MIEGVLDRISRNRKEFQCGTWRRLMPTSARRNDTSNSKRRLDIDFTRRRMTTYLMQSLVSHVLALIFEPYSGSYAGECSRQDVEKHKRASECHTRRRLIPLSTRRMIHKIPSMVQILIARRLHDLISGATHWVICSLRTHILSYSRKWNALIHFIDNNALMHFVPMHFITTLDQIMTRVCVTFDTKNFNFNPRKYIFQFFLHFC